MDCKAGKNSLTSPLSSNKPWLYSLENLRETFRESLLISLNMKEMKVDCQVQISLAIIKGYKNHTTTLLHIEPYLVAVIDL